MQSFCYGRDSCVNISIWTFLSWIIPWPGRDSWSRLLWTKCLHIISKFDPLNFQGSVSIKSGSGSTTPLLFTTTAISFWRLVLPSVPSSLASFLFLDQDILFIFYIIFFLLIPNYPRKMQFNLNLVSNIQHFNSSYVPQLLPPL